MNIKIGQKLTIFGVSEWMATTTKQEITITRLIDGRFVFKARGKRKEYYLTIKDNNLIFEGWDLPIIMDSDYKMNDDRGTGMITTGMFRGNACLNLCGDEEIVKDYVENKNLNEIFNRKDIIVLCKGREEKLLFPEIPTNHAVILRMRGL